jgi:hypothetical protein
MECGRNVPLMPDGVDTKDQSCQYSQMKTSAPSSPSQHDSQQRTDLNGTGRPERRNDSALGE